MTSGQIFVKAESLQHVDALKFRGAYNRIVQLSDEQKQAGVVACFSGNHAQGVAATAQILGVKATIVMLEDAPAIKVERTRSYGADVKFYDRYSENREQMKGEADVLLSPLGGGVVANKRCVVIAIGGNIDPLWFAEILQTTAPGGHHRRRFEC